MSNDVNAIIAQLQQQVLGLTKQNGAPNALSDAQAQQLLKDRPDVAAEYQRASAGADKNSPVYAQKGLDSPTNFAKWWYSANGGATSYNPNGTAPSPAQQTADDATKSATDATTSLVSSFKDLTSGLVKQIDQNKTDTAKTIADLSSSFATQQTSLLQGFQKAQADQASQMADLTKQMQQAALGTGQTLKRPNYAAALARNKALNSGGLGSTMLTGTGGVAPGSMSLGATSLLGGS